MLPNSDDLYETIHDINELDNINERVGIDNYKIVGFEKEVEELIKGLSRLKKPNVLILGDAGVGKTALVEKLATKINMGDVPKNLRNKTIYELNLNTTIAGTRYRGDFEKKVQKILDIVTARDDVILFVDEVHNIMDFGKTDKKTGSAIPLSETLKPYLARNKITLIGATTTKEYKKHIEPDSAFDRRFYKMTISESCRENIMPILFANRELYETHYGVKLKINDLETVIKNSRKRKGKYPDKALDELEDYCYQLKKNNEKEEI